ncbi:MAG: hypothetical protein R3C18_18030 [Planctomycetaceae bacterium]
MSNSIPSRFRGQTRGRCWSQIVAAFFLVMLLLFGSCWGVGQASITGEFQMAVLFGLFSLVCGVLALKLIWFALRALLNPLARLSTNNLTIRPGRTLQIRWNIVGRTDWIRRLEINLAGMHLAQSADSVSTPLSRELDNQTHRIEIFATTVAGEIEQGQTSLKIPTDLPLSNGIPPMQWRLLLRGEIPGWSNIVDEVPIQIVDCQ